MSCSSVSAKFLRRASAGLPASLAVAVFAFAATCSSSAAKQTKVDSGAVTFAALPDPGFMQPNVDVGDYRSYALDRKGTSSVAGRIRFSLDSGEAVHCTRGTTVLLFPDTRFVQWMLVRWADDIDGRQFAAAVRPRYDRHINAPAWLDDFRRRVFSV